MALFIRKEIYLIDIFSLMYFSGEKAFELTLKIYIFVHISTVDRTENFLKLSKMFIYILHITTNVSSLNFYSNS